MARLAWLTDIHLNFIEEDRLRLFLADVAATGADAVAIGGDIGEADSFAHFLELMASQWNRPIYFVLGNHDYYRSSIARVREKARSLGRHSGRLAWLSERGMVAIGDQTALVGHDGWGDGRVGTFLTSDVILNDYLLIEELRKTHGFPHTEQILTPELLAKLNALGDEAAEHFRAVLPEALKVRRDVIVLMHVPPFREACWYQGQVSDESWSPHFVCHAAGEALLDLMRHHPANRLTVLCGHTHSAGRVQILDNLEVITGDARYGEPKVQRVLEVV